ncbi:hypothetical protein DUI87_21084 [Hirundo rustica rustica]|uniref:Uncharacterized protein n=1 Tax=Hirundo rustica rustica TaxID=333673 RepID=A0A3M0JLU9_HIRRU|nr:hypothetical protein DUI87_21084 [Hirundo rustica rustica]
MFIPCPHPTGGNSWSRVVGNTWRSQGNRLWVRLSFVSLSERQESPRGREKLHIPRVASKNQTILGLARSWDLGGMTRIIITIIIIIIITITIIITTKHEEPP